MFLRLYLTPFVIGMGCFVMRGLGAEPAAAAAAAPEADAGPTVRVGVSAACFSHVAPGGIKLGAKLLAQHLSAELGRKAALQICETAETLAWMMTERDLDVLMMSAEMLIESRKIGEPLVACVMSGSVPGAETSWLLLANGANRAALKPGATVLLADGGRGRLPSLWLREVTRGTAGGLESPLFREVTEPRPELAVLRVFLGKAAACVVPESEFLAACADNPQINDRLVRVASSPAMPGAVLCVRTNDSKEFSEHLPAALAKLASSLHGRALARLLRTGEFAPFDPSSLPALQKLVESSEKSTAARILGASPSLAPLSSR
jgi:ABC-type phosphate/phosphonate transport system substrate-binding protein